MAQGTCFVVLDIANDRLQRTTKTLNINVAAAARVSNWCITFLNVVLRPQVWQGSGPGCGAPPAALDAPWWPGMAWDWPGIDQLLQARQLVYHHARGSGQRPPGPLLSDMGTRATYTQGRQCRLRMSTGDFTCAIPLSSFSTASSLVCYTLQALQSSWEHQGYCASPSSGCRSAAAAPWCLRHAGGSTLCSMGSFRHELAHIGRRPQALPGSGTPPAAPGASRWPGLGLVGCRSAFAASLVPVDLATCRPGPTNAALRLMDNSWTSWARLSFDGWQRRE